ncbi:hypothetical protein EKO04_006901 [Ascochyta lentis]|uniref:Uncharacterized protein n=1 Tax=Ascochyta lentis TaxID=205686 RepID=A0A8H7J2A9_9PLEO|nr:hypothetical protein EKO04_006901 [Ascochyta lentis]
MSSSGPSSFVAGDENLDLHHFFSFTRDSEAADSTFPLLPNSPPAVTRLASPFAGPHEDIQRQPIGWPSSSAAGCSNDLDTIDFDEFLALDEGHDGSPAVVEQRSSPPPSEIPSTPPKETTVTPRQSKKISAATDLKAAQAEIAQLKTALETENPQHELLGAPAGHFTTTSPCKRKSVGCEVSLPKRQALNIMGPIEAMWSLGVTEDERRAFRKNLASPAAPSSTEAHLDFSPPANSAHYISSQEDPEISPEDLLSMQQFLRDNTDLIHSTSQQVSTSTITSNMTPYAGNTKTKRTALKRAPKSFSKSTTKNAVKVTKKTTIPKKTQHKRTVSTSAITTPPPNALSGHRSMEEILGLNFYSLNDQEKCRVLLPMLRGLDPKELETSLAELPCIQAKGSSHHVRVARAIRNSPPTPEADAELAVKLTTGIPPTPTPIIEASHSPSPAPRASPSHQELPTSIGVSEDHGAIRQREALEKAELLQAQGKKR